MTKRYKTEALSAVHETALGLAEAGVMPKQTMQKFSELCLTPVEEMTPNQIHNLGDIPLNNDETQNKIYTAIVRRARKECLITFGDLATECGLKWPHDRYKLYSYLDDLLDISAKRNWPAFTVIIVTREGFESDKLEGAALDGFLTAAKDRGYTIGQPDKFVEEQTRLTFEWAHTALDNLTFK